MALAHVIVLVATGLLGVISSLVGELRPQWLVEVVLATAWGLTFTLYFTVFWSLTGQTPGMRLLRLRVLGQGGRPPSGGRSLLPRLVGLLLSIVPCFAGFVPVLFDERRRGLADFMAGTVVVYADRVPVDAGALVAPSDAPAAAAAAPLRSSP